MTQFRSPKDRVVDFALSWVGRYYREGESAQCANFVRHIFGGAQVDLGVAADPTDRKYMPSMALSPSFANSFAGDEIGERIERKDVKAGDIVMFRNTYGSFPPGVITHVGIALNAVEMVDRSTSSAPVKRRGIDTFLFAEARRPRGYGATTENDVRELRAWFHDGRAETQVDNDKKLDPTVMLDFTEKARILRINGREREVVAFELSVKFRDEKP